MEFLFRCLYHFDQGTWVDEPASRSGWIRTTCKVCGTLIGYRPRKEIPVVAEDDQAEDTKDKDEQWILDQP